MSKYQDKWSFWHDKHTGKNKIPSSYNGFIYTAYSKYLSPNSYDKEVINNRYLSYLKSSKPLIINRHPDVKYPVLSKDEIIGMVSLGLLTDSELRNSHYNFCNIDSSFNRKLTIKSFFTAAKSLYDVRKEHRNYFWENEMKETYPLAFAMVPWDIYYVKKFYNKRPSLFQTICFYLNFIFVLHKGNKSARMLLWLQLKDLDSSLVRYIPERQWVKDYFGEKHTLYTRFK